MTQPAQPVAGPYYYHAGHARLCLILSVLMFILAAFAFGGHTILAIGGWTWFAGAFAAFVLARVVP
jgi:accessory gene regulator protein AgrB